MTERAGRSCFRVIALSFIREVEGACFTPLVFACTGAAGKTSHVFLKRLASLLSEKRNLTYRTPRQWDGCVAVWPLPLFEPVCSASGAPELSLVYSIRVRVYNIRVAPLRTMPLHDAWCCAAPFASSRISSLR